MLLKQFLNQKQTQSLLEYAQAVDCTQPAYGTNSFITRLSNLEKNKFENVIKKGKNLFKKILPEYKFYYDDSCLFNVIDGGWVSPHTDICDEGKFQNTTLVILLQKAKNGGNILHGNNRIVMDAGDAYILNESIIHGLETVKGETSFRALVLWFKKTL
jgi:hypothetical protein